MENSRNKVSVVIPTYKRHSELLSRAIKSLENQTYKNVEIVIVDDNPPDSDYRDEIRNFIKQYDIKNIVYIENPKNMGGSIARNNGIAAASGDYITFLDDDDEYLPEKIEKQLNFMLENDYDMSFTDLKIVSNKYVDYREFSFIKCFDRESLLKYHLMRHLTGTPTFMYKAEKLRQIGGFEDVKMGQEFFLMFKTIENNLKIGYLPECHIIAYRLSDGISFGKNKISGERDLYAFKKKYFNILSFREKLYVRFRHFAVMSAAYIRNKKYFMALIYGIITFLASPLDFVNEACKLVLSNIRGKKLANKV